MEIFQSWYARLRYTFDATTSDLCALLFLEQSFMFQAFDVADKLDPKK